MLGASMNPVVIPPPRERRQSRGSRLASTPFLEGDIVMEFVGGLRRGWWLLTIGRPSAGSPPMDPLQPTTTDLERAPLLPTPTKPWYPAPTIRQPLPARRACLGLLRRRTRGQGWRWTQTGALARPLPALLDLPPREPGAGPGVKRVTAAGISRKRRSSASAAPLFAETPMPRPEWRRSGGG